MSKLHKYSIKALILLSLILSACSQPSNSVPQPLEGISNVAELIAQALKDGETRLYIQNQLHLNSELNIIEMTAHQLHSEASYQQFSKVFLKQGFTEAEALAQVKNLFAAFPTAFLVAPVHFEDWQAETQAPLVAYLSQGFDMNAQSIPAFDADGKTRTLSGVVAPNSMVLVLHEVGGLDESLSLDSTAPCYEPAHIGSTHTVNLPRVGGRINGGGLHSKKTIYKTWTYNPNPNWYIDDFDFVIEEGGYDHGYTYHFLQDDDTYVTINEVRESYEFMLDIGAELSDDSASLDTELTSTYEFYLSFLQIPVKHRGLRVEYWYGRGGWFGPGGWFYFTPTINLYCGSVDTKDIAEVNTRFANIVKKHTGQTPPMPPNHPKNYTVTVSVQGSQSAWVSGGGINCGAGRNTCSVTVREGTSITLRAYGATASWSGCDSANYNCIITVNRNRYIAARFVSDPNCRSLDPSIVPCDFR